MSDEYETLFSPFDVGNVTVKNRIVSTAHVTVYADDGMPAKRMRDYYRDKAAGGCGTFICFGSASVHETSPADDWNAVKLYEDRVIPHLQELSDMAHEHDVTIMSQITHRGRRGRSDTTWQRQKGPSPIKEPNHRENVGAMTKKDIWEIKGAYGDAAMRCKKGGFDGVEISAAHCHLVDQFWSPLNNTRTDEFGGSLENRLRFAFMVIEDVREKVGDDFVVGIRITGDDFREGGLDHPTMLEIAERLSEHGMLDFFDVIGGTGETHQGEAAAVPSMFFPLACFSSFAGDIRERVNEPVLAVGRINDPVVGERVLNEGHGDLVAMTRALIADPYLPQKAMEGRTDDIRQCMGYNEGCIDRQYQKKPLGCVQNPVLGYEEEWGTIPKAEKSKKVVVVGGGAAGMKAAWTALHRGHRVTLLEKNDELGGQMLIAKRAPKRQDFDGAGRWLELQIKKLGCEIRTGTEANYESVMAENPDYVVVATGAEAHQPPIPGLAESNAVSAWDVIGGKAPAGQRVVIVDEQGGFESSGAAETLLDEGRDVEMITPNFEIMQGLGATTKPDTLNRLYKKGLKVVPDYDLYQVDGKTLHFRNAFADETTMTRENVDVLVYSYGGSSINQLADQLDQQDFPHVLIGDAYAPRGLHYTIVESYKMGRQI
jgi:2,4-dienoyl-CoA reductase-like NADH-dependent reductase (Old Yellow Enzyme family)/thioredoxin reductase